MLMASDLMFYMTDSMAHGMLWLSVNALLLDSLVNHEPVHVLHAASLDSAAYCSHTATDTVSMSTKSIN